MQWECSHNYHHSASWQKAWKWFLVQKLSVHQSSPVVQSSDCRLSSWWTGQSTTKFYFTSHWTERYQPKHWQWNPLLHYHKTSVSMYHLEVAFVQSECSPWLQYSWDILYLEPMQGWTGVVFSQPIFLYNKKYLLCWHWTTQFLTRYTHAQSKPHTGNVA